MEEAKWCGKDLFRGGGGGGAVPNGLCPLFLAPRIRYSYVLYRTVLYRKWYAAVDFYLDYLFLFVFFWLGILGTVDERVMDDGMGRREKQLKRIYGMDEGGGALGMWIDG